VSQKPVSQTRDKLSPIEETSVEAGSLGSLGGLSGENVILPEQHQLDQDQEEAEHTASPRKKPRFQTKNLFAPIRNV